MWRQLAAGAHGQGCASGIGMVIIKVTKPIWQQDGGCGGGGGGVVLFFISMPHNLALYFSVLDIFCTYDFKLLL
jgi:hypothetical protein